MWGTIASLALGGANLLTGASDARTNRKVAKAQYELDKGRAERKAALVAESNKIAAGAASLQRLEQSLQNKRLGRRLEADMDVASKNYSQQLDQMSADKFTSRLQSAAVVGSISAMAASAGVGGASVEMVEQTERMRQARVENALDKDTTNLNYAKNATLAGLIDNYNASYDRRDIYADIDYTAPDLVIDTSYQYRYNPLQAVGDFVSGSQGNVSNLGLNISQAGFQGIDWFGTGRNNKGTGYKPLRLK